MAIAILDDRQSQRVCDLRTGEEAHDDSPSTQIVRGVLQRHPYPGETYLNNRWVSDTALDLMDHYRPQLVCLLYAYQYFALRHVEQDAMDRRRLLTNAFREVARFTNASHFTPVIVGTGDMVPVAGEIDLSGMDGRAVSGRWPGRYAGLHQPTAADLAFVNAHPQVERVVNRVEWIGLFPLVEPDVARLPDYLAVARQGWTFRTTGTAPGRVCAIPGESRAIPVVTRLGDVKGITGVRGLIESSLDRKKIALVVLEGMGLNDFTLQHETCENGADWFCYEPGEGQLLTVTTGAHQVFAFPPGGKDPSEEDAGFPYPSSGHVREIPEHTIGRDFSGRSIAVGNHSMLTHTVFGTDIALECQARNSASQACLGVIYK